MIISLDQSSGSNLREKLSHWPGFGHMPTLLFDSVQLVSLFGRSTKAIPSSIFPHNQIRPKEQMLQTSFFFFLCIPDCSIYCVKHMFFYLPIFLLIYLSFLCSF